LKEKNSLDFQSSFVGKTNVMETMPVPKTRGHGADRTVSMTPDRDIGLHTETFIKHFPK
jgi:hypothetical protein